VEGEGAVVTFVVTAAVAAVVGCIFTLPMLVVDDDVKCSNVRHKSNNNVLLVALLKCVICVFVL